MAQGWLAACERQDRNFDRVVAQHPELADWLKAGQGFALAMARAARQWGQLTDRQLAAARKAAGVDKKCSLG